MAAMPTQEPLGYSEEDDIVTVRMMREDFSRIAYALGRQRTVQTDALMNRINTGNPHYTPYAIPPEPLRHCSVRTTASTADDPADASHRNQ